MDVVQIEDEAILRSDRHRKLGYRIQQVVVERKASILRLRPPRWILGVKDDLPRQEECISLLHESGM